MKTSHSKPVIEFDEAHHIYTVDARAVPSVTTILGDCGLINKDWFLPEHAERGSNVHTITEEWDTAEPGSCIKYSKPLAGLEGYLAGWMEFRLDTGFQPDLIEQRVYNDEYNYAGTLDRYGLLNGKPTIIDIKTSATPYKWWKLQLAAYAGCCSIPLDKIVRLSVQLMKDGSYNVHPYPEIKYDLESFQACVRLWYWKKHNKELPK